MGNNIDPVKREESPVEKLASVLSNEDYQRTNTRVGRILTIIDASFQDREQREAVKSLVRQALYDERTEIYEIVNQFAKAFGKQALEPTDAYIDKWHRNEYPVANYFGK